MIRPVQKDLFAVIGNPVSHSLSPIMMNAVFESLHIPAVYLALQADEPAADLEMLSKMGFRGLSVTLPHKEEAYRLAQKVDETAQAIGAVNTLRKSENGWEGRNTDCIGATRALRSVAELQNKRALVIGAGGVARAVVYGLKLEGASVTVSNRSMGRGESLAVAFECDFLPLSRLREGKSDSFDIAVQCTSVGLGGGDASTLAPDSFFHPEMVAMDTVYKPLWTPFLLAARRMGCKVIDGLEMLLYQGAAQLEWWLERDIPEENGVAIMRKALRGAIAHE